MRKLTMLILMLASPALADTKAGVDAWERGDYKTAIDEWRAAAGKGDPDAQFNLGQAYKLGRGVPIDLRKAEDFYRQAAAQGHVQAADNYGLTLFQNGKSHEAIPYLEGSVAHGEPRAQYILGTMLFNGTDAPKDWVRAYALLTQSARAGLPQARDTLAQMDQMIPAAERQQGLALAERAIPAPSTDVTAGSAPSVRKVAVRVPKPSPAAPPASKLHRAASKAVAPSSGWRVQLGAFADPANARRLWAQIGGRFAGRSVSYEKTGALTRVLVGPFSTRAKAEAACGTVSPCRPVRL